MKNLSERVSKRLCFSAAILLTVSCSLSILVSAQMIYEGQNAVYNSTGTSVVGSTSFIDATPWGNASTDICSVLFSILSSSHYPLAAGSVIDARGLPGTTHTSMNCASGNTPWYNLSTSTYLNYPSTILLPPGTIQITVPWVVPNNTRLIGEGDGIPSNSFVPGTIIQAASPNFSGSMIQFGSSNCPVISGATICSGVSAERLTLDGQGQAIGGITNQYSQNGSYVDHVSLYRIRGTGLLVEGSANGSGPYSNITFDTGSFAGTSSTVCASINGTTGTLGIHGLSCNSESNDAPAAVLLDGSNNSIEDVRIVGFYDGILIGMNANAQSNVITNIIGDTNQSSNLNPINTIHIASNGHTVSDISLMGIANLGDVRPYTIQDDLTGAHLSDTTVGIYALGESPASGQYSRYTTSPNLPTWSVGSAAPSGTCLRGSLYSCVGGSTSCSTYALWTCALNVSTLEWRGVK